MRNYLENTLIALLWSLLVIPKLLWLATAAALWWNGAFGTSLVAMPSLIEAMGWPSLADVEMAVFQTIIVVLFVTRRPAVALGNRWEGLVGLTGTLVPLLVQRGGPGLGWWTVAFQSVALLGMIAAVLSLNTSFGVVPADRGVKTGGMYRLVRHPVYATELLFMLGFVAGNLTWRNLVVGTLFLAAEVVRAWREELLLKRNPEYLSYCQRVRSRFLPFLI